MEDRISLDVLLQDVPPTFHSRNASIFYPFVTNMRIKLDNTYVTNNDIDGQLQHTKMTQNTMLLQTVIQYINRCHSYLNKHEQSHMVWCRHHSGTIQAPQNTRYTIALVKTTLFSRCSKLAVSKSNEACNILGAHNDNDYCATNSV